MKISAPKKIRVEDFPSEYEEVAVVLGDVYNQYLENVYNVLSRNVGITDNMNQDLKSITVQVESDGIGGQRLTETVEFKNTLRGKLQGLQVVRVLQENDVRPTGQPFLSFIEDNSIITVTHIAGLPNDTEFQLVVLLIGE